MLLQLVCQQYVLQSLSLSRCRSRLPPLPQVCKLCLIGLVFAHPVTVVNLGLISKCCVRTLRAYISASHATSRYMPMLR